MQNTLSHRRASYSEVSSTNSRSSSDATESLQQGRFGSRIVKAMSGALQSAGRAARNCLDSLGQGARSLSSRIAAQLPSLRRQEARPKPLAEFLEVPKNVESFLKHVQAEHSEENLKFYEVCLRFQQLHETYTGVKKRVDAQLKQFAGVGSPSKKDQSDHTALGDQLAEIEGQLHDLAKSIHTQFVRNDAPQQVNLPGATFAAVNDAMKSGTLPEIASTLETGRMDILALMASDTYARYLRTDAHKALSSGRAA